MSAIPGWVSAIFGPIRIKVAGVLLGFAPRSTVNFVGITIEDDADNDQTNFTSSGAAAGSAGDLQVNTAGELAGLSPGTSGNLCRSNGTAWTSAAPTFSDALFKIADDGDATKIAAFQCSGITTGNTRTISIPDATGTVLLRGDTATVTNKAINWANNTMSFTSAEARAACGDETGSGVLMFNDTPTLITPKIADSAGGQFYNVAVSNLGADRTVTLPLLTGNDEFVFKDHAVILTAKTYRTTVTAMPALAIDWSLGNMFTKTLSAGGNTITFSNDTDGQVITVVLTSNGGGSTVTWPAGVHWTGGTEPTQTSTGTDVYTLMKAGGTVRGSYVQNFS